MDAADILAGVFDDGSTILLALLVFLATTVLTFGVMLAWRARGAVKRRAAGLADEGEDRALRSSSLRAVQRLLDYTTKHYAVSDKDKDKGDVKVLRRRMVQAGIFDTHAVAYFFAARTALAIGVAFAIFIFMPMILTLKGTMFWFAVIAGGILGYVVRACISTGASPGAATSTVPVFRTLWTCWWCARIPA